MKKKAAADKERYAKELAEAPPPEDGESEEEDQGKKRKKKKKKVLQEGEPKKPMTAYLMFGQEIRKKIVEESKEKGEKLPPKEIMQKIGEEWQKLSADGKQPYLDKQKQAVTDYKEAHAKWEAEHQGGSSPKTTKKVKRKREDDGESKKDKPKKQKTEKDKKIKEDEDGKKNKAKKQKNRKGEKH